MLLDQLSQQYQQPHLVAGMANRGHKDSINHCWLPPHLQATAGTSLIHPMQPLRPLAFLAAAVAHPAPPSAAAAILATSPISPVNHHHFNDLINVHRDGASPTPTEGNLDS